MTIERVLEYNGKIDFYNLQQIKFAETDCTSETTDMDVSNLYISFKKSVVHILHYIHHSHINNHPLQICL